jgi:hypothetical protein
MPRIKTLKEEISTIRVVGGVKRAPRGYSMGQMGQRARHG